MGLFFTIACFGCLGSQAHFCGDGLVCPTTMVCAEEHGICVLPEQLAACRGKETGLPCSFPGAPAGTFLCDLGVCLVAGPCGNWQIDPGEECDREELGGHSCVSFGYSDPDGLACGSNCRLDPSGCAPTCGDGQREPFEDCDDGNPEDGDGCSATCTVEACVVFVAPDSPVGAPDGRHWWTAWPTLAAALADPRASQPHCELWIARGTHTVHQGSREDSLLLPPGAQLYGGFVGTEHLRSQRDPALHLTELQGMREGGREGDPEDHVVHVLVGAPGVILDGLLITGGAAHHEPSADATGLEALGGFGGGLLIPPGAHGMLIRNCTFTGNSAIHGGAIANLATDTQIEGSLFVGNAATHEEASTAQQSRGGAILNARNASLTLSQSRFEENLAGSGGAIAHQEGSELTLQGCWLERNSASYMGGALFVDAPALVQGSVFQGNYGYTGGAALNASGALQSLYQGCRFEGNQAHTYGAALHNHGCAATIEDSDFVDNRPAQIGGALYDRYATTTIRRSSFTANSANNAGAIGSDASTTDIESSIFNDNWATSYGGHIRGERSATLTLTNCTLVLGNAGGTGSAVHLSTGASLFVANSILWGNAFPVIEGLGGTVEARYSLIQGNHPGEGILDATPTFVGLLAGDLRLAAGSPGIDAGDGDAAPPLDKDGLPRCDDPDVPNAGVGQIPYTDLGAFERQAPSCL